MDWEILADLPFAVVRRRGRFIVAELKGAHRTICTSVRNGGASENVRYLVNHQSCEGAGHNDRFHAITSRGEGCYHDLVCAETDLPTEFTAVMGTAANMNYAALSQKRDLNTEVFALVTAGVETNATCAGDPAAWRETADGFVTAPAGPGTINTILLVNTPVTDGALARLIVTMTEAKSAALQRLAVPSRYSEELATGTGTDQYCMAAPLTGSTPPLTSASTHSKFGEVVSLAVRDATLEALRWQNGLEPSYTRGLFHALGRYGFTEKTIFDRLNPLLQNSDLELLRKNNKAVFYEPLVAAAAHAVAAVLDRARHGTLPQSCLREAIVYQAASLAAGLSAKPERWPDYRARLHAASIDDPREFVPLAIALGWSEKWKP